MQYISFNVVTVMVLCTLFVESCLAINDRPLTQNNCIGTGLTWVDSFVSSYAPVIVSNSVCIFNNYEEACPTLSGVVACDTTINKCVPWKGTTSWTVQNTFRQWINSTTPPMQCLRHGTLKFFPDASVLVVVQPLISGLVFIGLAIAAIIIFLGKVHIVSIIIFELMCVAGIIQLVSYYYLNAYIVIAAGMIALGAYARARPISVGFGMFILLVAFYWVTFETGLGDIQHHSRRLAGRAQDDTYELKCNMYYAGFFTYPRVLMADRRNAQDQYRAYCGREFLAGQLFVMIFQEYLLILLMAMGAFAVTKGKQVKQVKQVTRAVTEKEPYNEPDDLREEITEAF